MLAMVLGFTTGAVIALAWADAASKTDGQWQRYTDEGVDIYEHNK